jgi:autotransporter-associated beta strand protein
LVRISLIAIGLSLFGLQTFGQTWTNAGGGDWKTAANWSGPAPTDNGSGTLTFSGLGVAVSTNNDATNFTATGIAFANTSSGAFTLAGNSLTLGGNISTSGTTGSPTHVISLNMSLNGTRTISAISNNSINVTGVISETGGSQNLVKASAGVLTLSGANTFSGQLRINRGTVIANTLTNSGLASSVGSGGLIRMGNSTDTGALSYTGSSTSTNRQVQIGNGTLATDIGGASISANNNLVFANPAFNVADTGAMANRALTLDGTGVSEIQGTIIDNSLTGKVDIMKSGTGTWVLSGNNSYSNGTTINAGTLRASHNSALGTGSVLLGSNATLQMVDGVSLSNSLTVLNGANKTIGLATGATNATYAGSITITEATSLAFDLSAETGQTLTVSGVVGGTGGGGISKVGNGSVVLTNANTFSGQSVVINGALRITNGGALGATGAGNGSEVRGGSSLELSGGIAVGDETLLLNGNGLSSNGALRNVSGNNSWGGAITLNNNSRITSDAGTLTIDVSSGNAISGSNLNLTFAGAGNTVVSDAISLGNGSVTKNGSGTVNLLGDNVYTGTTTINGGTLLINGNQIASTGAVSVTSGTTLGGSGTVGGLTTFNSGAIHSPGNSPGLQTFNSGLTYNTGSIFNWELIANDNALANRGINYDGVDVTGGILTIQSGVTSNLIFNGVGSTVLWSDSFWDTGRQWLVFDNANAPSVTGSIFNVSLGLDSGGNTLSSVRPGSAFSWTQIGNDLYLTYSVPEPSTVCLLAIAIGGITILRHRRLRSSKV